MEEKNIECNRCGACCKVLHFIVDFPRGKERIFVDYYKKHGCKITKAKQGWSIVAESRCKWLSEDNLCRLHHTKGKPYLCRVFKGQDHGSFYIPPECVFNKKNRGK